MTMTIHVGFEDIDFRAGPGKLYIADPSSQTDLLYVVEKGVEPVSYLNFYDTDDAVRCAFCDSHQAHNKGLTVEMKDGSIALCGRDCAKVFFGRDRHKELMKDLKGRIDRNRRNELIGRTFAGIADLKRHVTDELVAHEEALRELTRNLAMTMTRTAEQDLVSGAVPDISARFLTLYAERPISANLQGFVRAMERAAQDPDRLSDLVMQRAVGIRQRIIRSIEDLADFFDAARAFLEERNFQRFMVYQNARRLHGVVVSMRHPITGPECHVGRPYEDILRFTLPAVPDFDGRTLTALLNRPAS